MPLVIFYFGVLMYIYGNKIYCRSLQEFPHCKAVVDEEKESDCPLNWY